MATTNRERVGKAMDLLRDGLGPFVEREFRNAYGAENALSRAQGYFYQDSRLSTDGELTEWDSAALLGLMSFSWQRRLPADPRPDGALDRERATRLAERMGASGALLQR